MTKNYDESVEINHIPNWPYIPDHPYRILIIDVFFIFFYTSKIHLNQSINYLLMEEKK